MGILCQTLIKMIEDIAPPRLAENWDNVGLLVGDPQAEITGVLVALDLNLDVLGEAQGQGANFILVHHPPIFHPLKRLHASEPQGKLLLEAIRAGINIYAAHTNLDLVSGGVNDGLAKALGLSDVAMLAPAVQDKCYKLVVFVPETHEEIVRKAIGDAGAGFIGNYSHCTFRTLGTGTFLPQFGASPFLGKVDKEEEVVEFRLETIVPQSILRSVLEAMLSAHPYEEVAYDLYPLANEGKPIASLGRIGNLPEVLTLDGLVDLVKESLSLSYVRVVKGSVEVISRVAVCGGSGGRLIREVARAGAHALITGDVNYHQGQEAQSLGLTVIDAGHGPTEKVVLPMLLTYLKTSLSTQKLALPLYISQVNTDPWQHY